MSEEQINEPAPVADEAAPPEKIKIGAVLAAARTEQGLSVADVSRALKFSVRQLEALEKDDYSELTGNTFLRGFVRSYARFLKLDETPLLDALQQEVPPSPMEVHEVESMNAAMPQQTPSVAPARLRQWVITAVICAALIGLGWAAVHAGWFSTELKEPLAGTAQPAPMAIPDKEAESAATITQPTATVVNPGEAMASGLRQLEFAFTGTSWVEVKDANQAIVLTGRFDESARQSVQGFPPFQVVIGNAAAVKLKYESRNIDLLPYVRAEVARLTLDDNSK